MSSGWPDPLPVQDLLQAVRLAGDAIMAIYASADEPLAVNIKSDLSPVTAADLAAHRVLVRELQTLTPAIPVVSEEDEGSSHSPQQYPCYWLIDPLDGTREFISRNGEFTVNLALIQQNAPVWGCVYAPALELMYWGGVGTGAFRSAQGETTAARVTSDASPQAACRVIASKSHLNPQTEDFIARLGAATLVQAGSSLKFCRIAEGAADLYPRMGPTCEWDTAAAQAVLEAAGGFVHDLHGQPLRYGKAEILNPFFIAGRPGIAWS